ncbi:putative ferritin-1 [Peptococcaceae bacterium CEB3]|nr:putative ferritin-1 [Peptococcaceae bacterium CEB3]
MTVLGARVEQELNGQLQKEFYSAYFYLGMQAYFAAQNLDGFANYFRVQVQEERDHALAFFNYLNKVGGRIVLAAIQEPPSDFSSPADVFDRALQHEQYVTKSLYAIMDAAREARDHTTEIFLQWFITEQAEEEENMGRVLKRLKLVKEDSAGLFIIDNELAQRVYTPAAIPGLSPQP